VPEVRCDVLILGAGPAGSAAALALLARGIRRIVVADRIAPKPFTPGESATPDVPPLLAKLGLDASPPRFGARAYYGNLSAWGGPPALSLFGRRGPGWHIDRTAFETWLREEVTARGAPLICPARLAAIRAAPDGWEAELDGFGTVRASVVVDAAGRRAPLATRLGAKRHNLDRLVALAVRVPAPAQCGLEGYTFIESVPDGWWYAAHLPSGDAVVMLMTDRDLAAPYRVSQAFVQAWRAAPELGRRLPPPRDGLVPRVFAAQSGFASKVIGERWIVVGDAAMAFDPLTSSGLSGALNDAFAAAGTVEAMLDGRDESTAYAKRARDALGRYLAGHAAYYGLEQRWPASSFWARRSRHAQPLTPRIRRRDEERLVAQQRG
jgi:flavin-dependent dehydrogenase